MIPGLWVKKAVTLVERFRDLVAATPVSSVDEPYVISSDELEQLEGYGGVYDPLDNGTYSVATERTQVRGHLRVEKPWPGMPITAAFASATVGVLARQAPTSRCSSSQQTRRCTKERSPGTEWSGPHRSESASEDRPICHPDDTSAPSSGPIAQPRGPFVSTAIAPADY